MRLVNGQFECMQCGAHLDISTDVTPQVEIHGAGGKPNERVIFADGKEVHRCRRGDSVAAATGKR
jgi:hypothetical protein